MKRTRDTNLVPLGPALPLDTPFVLNVDPASACNFSCNYCFHAPGVKMEKKGIMSWNIYLRVLKDMAKFPSTIKTLRLYAFGEPLLNTRFSDMISIAKERGVSEDIDTTTNGSLLTPQLSQRIIDAGLDRINISVMGMNDDQYLKFVHKNFDFKKYVDNIADFYTRSRGKCVVFAKINGDLISKEDEQRFTEVFSPITDGCAVEHVMDCWYGVEMRGVKKNRDVGVYGAPLTNVKVCPYIFYSMCVQYDGEVSACFLDWNRKLIIGNIGITSLVNIWNGTIMRLYRVTMLQGDRRFIPICNNCDQLKAGEPVNIDHLASKLLEKI